ncbi:MAG TPA: pentapeptide repeat-containing protein [Candidatus Onthocola stercoravium]|nr:pentapeptide repeat-containing protein [Candidatus Onthocola stercoravium]
MNLNIEIIDVKHPIFQSELIDWMVSLSKINSSNKRELDKIYRQILSLLDNPDDYIVENLRIFINGKPFSCDIVKEYGFKKIMQELSNYPKITVGNNKLKSNVEVEKENGKDKQSLVRQLKRLSESETPTFFYHSVFISENDLLEEVVVDGLKHFIINQRFLPFLRFLDLSQIDFHNTDLRGIDLSYTNIRRIDFASLYKNSLENTTLEGVNLAGQELENICADGANLTGTFLLIDLDSVSIAETILDGTVILWKNGKDISNTRARKPINVILHF